MDVVGYFEIDELAYQAAAKAGNVIQGKVPTSLLDSR